MITNKNSHQRKQAGDIKEIDLELLDQSKEDFATGSPHVIDGSKEYLRSLEALHKALSLYLWLSYRFAGVFRSQALAFHVKSLVEEKIDKCLAEVSLDEDQRKKLVQMRRKAVSKGKAREVIAGDEPEAAAEAVAETTWTAEKDAPLALDFPIALSDGAPEGRKCII